MKTWIYQHSTGFLNYTSVLSNTTILLDLPNVQEKPLSKLLTCILSAIKTGLQSYCDTSYSRDGMNQMWIPKNSKYLLEYIQLRCLSSCNIITIFDSCNNIWLVYPLHNYSSLYKLREMIQLCFMKKDQRRCTHLVRGRDISYFVNNHSDSTKKFFETDIINISSFLLITYLFSLVDVFFNRQSPCLLVQIVLLFSPTCSFIRMRQTSYRGFSRETIRQYHVPLYRWCPFTK